MNQAWLLDAALLQGHPLQARLNGTDAVALYGDLAPQAAAVGPWLLAGADLQALRALELPFRYGAAIVQWQGELSIAIQHLRAMRTVTLQGGERFYLRFADHRPFQAVLSMLRKPRRARLLGPFEGWTICDRYDQIVDLAAGLPARADTSASNPLLHLTNRDMDTLQDLQLPERLSAAVTELQEPGLQPGTNPTQFQCIEAAAAYARTNGLTSWPLLRAVALLAVRTGGAALQTVAFGETVLAARERGDAQPVLDWTLP